MLLSVFVIVTVTLQFCEMFMPCLLNADFFIILSPFTKVDISFA